MCGQIKYNEIPRQKKRENVIHPECDVEELVLFETLKF